VLAEPSVAAARDDSHAAADALPGAPAHVAERVTPAHGESHPKKTAAGAKISAHAEAPRSPAAPVAAPAPALAPSAPAAPGGQSGADLVRQASAAFVRGQMPLARSLYREASERAPSNADAWRGLALVSSRMGEHGEAERAFKRYLALRPNAPDADAIRKKLAAP
jgi:tetratricopeptide (TPR) repeat protein